MLRQFAQLYLPLDPVLLADIVYTVLHVLLALLPPAGIYVQPLADFWHHVIGLHVAQDFCAVCEVQGAQLDLLTLLPWLPVTRIRSTPLCFELHAGLSDQPETQVSEYKVGEPPSGPLAALAVARGKGQRQTFRQIWSCSLD